MKARIKETGEIIDLAQEVRGHKGESFQWFQIEIIPEQYDEFSDWQSFRNQAAKDILCAIISQPNLGYYGEEVENAVIFADKLIFKLKEKEEK